MGLSRFSALLACQMGTTIGVLLILLDAPLWAYYAASIFVVPLVVYELRRHTARDERENERS